MSYNVQPGNASAPQNQLQRYSWGIRPESETGDYIGRWTPVSSGDGASDGKSLLISESKQPSQQVRYTNKNTASEKQQQKDATKYGQLEFSITLLVRRG
jgi:hypothetical protein